MSLVSTNQQSTEGLHILYKIHR